MSIQVNRFKSTETDLQKSIDFLLNHFFVFRNAPSRDESFRSKTSFSLRPDPQELDVTFLFLYQYTLVITKGRDGHSAAAELFKSNLIVIN